MHEQGTAYMAFGYAQSTGKVGTNLVVPGPGLLNASAGLSTAFACGAKVLCLAGQIPSKLIGKGIGQLHELSDQPGAVASVTKWRGRAESPAIVPEKVREAFKQLNSGRSQPVLLEMSPDIMATEGEVELLNPIKEFIRGITSYSPGPLYFGIFVGFISILASLILICYAFWSKFSGAAIPGSSGVIITVAFFSGTILTTIGITGLYIARIYAVSYTHLTLPTNREV